MRLMMKVLFINSHYDVGSTGKLGKSFLSYAREKGHDVGVIYATGPQKIDIPFIKLKYSLTRKITIVMERLLGSFSFSPFSTLKAIYFIRKFCPDVIYFGNLHGYYINYSMLYKYVNKIGIPVVQLLWDEFPMTGSCTFSFECEKFQEKCNKCPRLKDYPRSIFFDNSFKQQMIKKKLYKENNRCCFVSVPFTAERAKLSMLLCDKEIVSVDEAVDQKKYFYPRDTDDLRLQLKISREKRIILTVGVYPSERKGGRYFLELAEKCKENPDYVFIHIGFDGDKRICPSNYIPIGYVSDQDLMAKYYSLADLFICTSFAETQPNTCLEALSCGTSICGFNISGIPTCADYPYGQYVEPRDVEALKRIVLKTRKKTEDKISQTVKYARSRFSSEKYNEILLNIGLNLKKNCEE